MNTSKFITVIADVLPGYNLTRQGEAYFLEGTGGEFDLGCELIADPFGDDENIAKEDPRWEAYFKFCRYTDALEAGDFRCDPYTGHHLFVACQAAGYDPEKHGVRIVAWLLNYVARAAIQQLTSSAVDEYDSRFVECPNCSGTGEASVCDGCNGYGWVEDPDGGTMTCPECGGERCSFCDGEGIV